jgi:hypothetical protein
MLSQYGQGRNELIMMVQDLSHRDDDERLILKLDAEHKTALQDLLRLELNEQIVHDEELSQLHDDVLYHINSSTDEVVAEIERFNETNSYGASPVNDFNCDWYQEDESTVNDLNKNTDESTVDDLNENTDTEDGHDEAMELMQSNMQLMKFLDRQRTTIARLRARIFRLNDTIIDLTQQMDNIRKEKAGHGNDKSVRIYILYEIPQWIALTYYGTLPLIRSFCSNETMLEDWEPITSTTTLK